MLQILWIIVAALLALLAIAFLDWIPYIFLGVCALVLFGWVLISTLSPAVPDRTCPRCGRQGLVKIRRGKPGVRCEHCDFEDKSMHVAYLDEW